MKSEKIKFMFHGPYTKICKNDVFIILYDLTGLEPMVKANE